MTEERGRGFGRGEERKAEVTETGTPLPRGPFFGHPQAGWETVLAALTVGLLTLTLLNSDVGCIQGKHEGEMQGREGAGPGARPSCGRRCIPWASAPADCLQQSPGEL